MSMTQHAFDNEDRLISLISYNSINLLNEVIIAVHYADKTGRNGAEAMRLAAMPSRLIKSPPFIKGLTQ